MPLIDCSAEGCLNNKVLTNIWYCNSHQHLRGTETTKQPILYDCVSCGITSVEGEHVRGTWYCLDCAKQQSTRKEAVTRETLQHKAFTDIAVMMAFNQFSEVRIGQILYSLAHNSYALGQEDEKNA